MRPAGSSQCLLSSLFAFGLLQRNLGLAFQYRPSRHPSASRPILNQHGASLFATSSPETSNSLPSPLPSVQSIERASNTLKEWDQFYSNSQEGEAAPTTRQDILDAVRFLTITAFKQREQDPTKGRLMLGICASSAAQGIAALKSWVSSLDLPRGLLHGMDDGGVPLDIVGGVFIKYNTGGVYTFADIRKSGIGFDAIWKPGDAMLENYDGNYRGVYFQVELDDGALRQYLCPLDLFGEILDDS